jgi:VWFA-related protein
VSLVRLDVQVVDASGRPIPDIRPDEVRIVEGSANRPVVLFQRVAGGGGSYVEAAERTIASDISTNEGAPQGQLFVFVFDQEHIRSGGEEPVRAAADAFLRQRVRPQDRVAIYGLPGPGPAQPFTANLLNARQQLARVRGGLVRTQNGAVTEMTISEAYEIVRGNEFVILRFITREGNAAAGGGAGTDVTARFAEDPQVLRRLVKENAQSIVMRADAESRMFLQSFADLLRGLKGIDGRKTVVFFSEGFYSDNLSRELEEVAAAAAETYSVIYSFDLNRRIDLAAATKSTSDEPIEISNRLDPLGSLAAETNGALVKDATTHLDTAFGSLVPDDGSYYLVGFEPGTSDTNDSHYRRVRVEVTRPGARVLSRTGYAAAGASTPADRHRAIDTALAAPFTQQSLKLEYTTYVGQSVTKGQQRVAVSLLAELPVKRSGTEPRREGDAADIVFVVRESRTGRVAASGTDQIALPDATGGSSFSTGRAPWHVAFDLPAGDYLMRCVVREPGGIIGSADRRFTVRALGGYEVAASDLLLYSTGDRLPVRARGYTGGLLTGSTRLYAPSVDKLQSVTARLELTPNDDTPDPGAVRRVIDGTLGDVLVGSGTAMRDVLFAVPLEKLAAGPYVARAIIRVDGELVADLRRPVDVTVGDAPPTSPSASAGGPRPRDVLDGEIARKLIQDATSDSNDPVLRGLAELGRENYGQAAATLGAAFTAQPGDARLAFVLGWARVGAGDPTGAVTAFRNAALADPKLVAAHLALAQTYLDLGNPALAAQALEAGLRAVPGSIELQRMRAEIKR